MYERILLAVDGSEHAVKAAAQGAALAKLCGAEVLVFHARELGLGARAGAFPLEGSQDALDLVNGVVHDLKEQGVTARGEARSAPAGRVAPEILDAAGTFRADLIVMGSRGLSDFAGLLLGSVAHKVIHHADRPVLVVR